MKTIIETALETLNIIHDNKNSFTSKEVHGVFHAPIKNHKIITLIKNSKADSPYFQRNYIDSLLSNTQRNKTLKVTREHKNGQYHYSLVNP